MNKIKQIIIIIIILFGISFSGTCFAGISGDTNGFTVSGAESNGLAIGLGYVNQADVAKGDDHFIPTKFFDNGIFFCIEYGGTYKTYDKKTKTNQKMVYTKGVRLTESLHMDEVYCLAKAYANNFMSDTRARWIAQFLTWMSSVRIKGSYSDIVNINKDYADQASNALNEGLGYNNFYNSIKNGFSLTSGTTESNVTVKKVSDGYIVGPIKVNYTNGCYNSQNKFSWMSGVTVNTDKTTGISATITDSNGNAYTSYGRDGSTNLNGSASLNPIAFYIKFKDDAATKINAINVTCGYIGSCSAEMYQYNGVRKDTEIGRQTLMGVFGTPKMNISSKDINVIPNGIPLTMNISGTAFLDYDYQNNLLDENRGERLPNVEVRLYNSKNELKNITVTDSNGDYKFTGLSLNDTYKVGFVYNGMLYTAVTKNTNTEKGSKATEDVSSRTSLNNKFKTISAYPLSYQTTDIYQGRGIKNKIFLQEDVSKLFIELIQKMASNGGNLTQAFDQVKNNHRSDSQISEKLQYIADCRVIAYSDQCKCDTTQSFSGTYEIKNVNIGIKSRPAFDLSLYKDMIKAEISINGKNETYNFEGLGSYTSTILESTYQSSMRQAYIKNTSFVNNKRTRKVESQANDLYIRLEDIVNGQNSTNSGIQKSGYVVAGNYDNLKTSTNDRLKVQLTYKIAVKNQSSVKGAVTEIVDYYDKNCKFKSAYIMQNGRKVTVTSSTNSIFTGTEKKATKNGYNTIYLRPSSTTLGTNSEQCIYVELELTGSANDVGSLLTSTLLSNKTLNVMNIAEINGYKTDEGIVDLDSTPGNLDIKEIDDLNNLQNYITNNSLQYEDDSSRAPVLHVKKYEPRTIEGTVFEDFNRKLTGSTSASGVTASGITESSGGMSGKGVLDDSDTKVKGATVELIEIKDGQMIVRATATTNEKGWYGFIGVIPGDYTVRYTWGDNDKTAMNKNSQFIKGENETSYNGQDYEATTFSQKGSISSITPKTDEALKRKYTTNNANRNNKGSNQGEYEQEVSVENTQKIQKYTGTNGGYWYQTNDYTSDASEYENRKNQVISYIRTEYGKEIVNHKAEVLSSFQNPQQEHITKEVNRNLANELERRTYRYAYTPQMEVEIEYATKETNGGQAKQNKITGIDFGIIERPEAQLTIDQDVKNVKVTLANGTILFDTETKTNNVLWINKGDLNAYDKEEFVNINMDEELITGAKIEVTYNITVKNNSKEELPGTTRAKQIVNYVANNLNYREESNKNSSNQSLWKIVPVEQIQNGNYSTLVNGVIDLTSQSVILQATENNPLTKALKPGEQATTELKLEKILSAESTTDDLKYANLSEIIEIENTEGRYDDGAIPGNQKLEQQPREHDTSGASGQAPSPEEITNNGKTTKFLQDGTITITPPTGTKYIYYIIGITGTLILAVGIFCIKKYVLNK